MQARVSQSLLSNMFGVVASVVSEAVLTADSAFLRLHGARKDKRVSVTATVSASGLTDYSPCDTPVGIDVSAINEMLSVFDASAPVTINASQASHEIGLTQPGTQYRRNAILQSAINQYPTSDEVGTPHVTAMFPADARSVALGVQAAALCSSSLTISIQEHDLLPVISAVGDTDSMSIEIGSPESISVYTPTLQATYPADIIAQVYHRFTASCHRIRLSIDETGVFCLKGRSRDEVLTVRVIVTPDS